MAHVNTEYRLISGILTMKHARAPVALLALTLIRYRGQHTRFFIWFVESVNHDFVEKLQHQTLRNSRIDNSHYLAADITAQRDAFLSVCFTLLRDNRAAAFGSCDPMRDDRELNCHSYSLLDATFPS